MKRILATAYSMLDIAVAILLVALLMPAPAYAYVDPSVMTYTIQAVAGAAVALSAVLGIAFRRTRKLIFRLFRIDENANKIKDPSVIRLNPNNPESAEILSSADTAALHDKLLLEKGPRVKTLSGPQRLARALVTCGLPVFTLVIASILELAAGGASSINFTFFDILPIVLSMGIVCWLIISGLVSLLRGRAFDVASTLLFTIGLGFYVQALFLNWPMTVADGSPIDFKSKRLIASMIGGALVWLCLIAGMLVFNAKKKSVCRTLTIALSCVLIIVQGASLVSIGFEQADRIANSGPKRFMSQDGLFEVSATDNVIVMVLDTVDIQLVEAAFQQDPSLFDEYTGFTYFKNSLAVIEPTRYAIPYLLTGVNVEEGDTWDTYAKRRMENTELIEEIANRGYSIGIYSDSIGGTSVHGYAENIVYLKSDDLDLNYATLPGKLLKMSLYRDLPWVLKPVFHFSTDEINRSSLRKGLNAYVMDDLAYADHIFTEGIQLDDNEKDFKFIHLQGAHYPLIMDETGHLSATGSSDQITQTRGTIRVVGEYLHQLKELGVYDQSTIIITADHGFWYANRKPVPRPLSALLLVKPSETAEEAVEPLKVSTIPTGHVDVPATIIDAVGGDSTKYGTTVFEVTEEDRPRYFWHTIMDGGRTNADWDWVQYEVDGNVLNFDNWRETGVVVPITPEDKR